MKIVKESLFESVRHGMFPAFVIDLDSMRIHYTTVNSDIGVDAYQENIFMNGDDGQLRFSMEGVNERYMKSLGEECLKMLLDGIPLKEVKEHLKKELEKNY